MINFGILVCSLMLVWSSQAGEPTCQSDIYCYGKLLHTVQMASVYHDSKTFVDMKIRNSRNETLISFEKMMRRTGENPSKKEILRFIEENFEPAGSEFEEWDPSDWVKAPRFLNKIHDKSLREWTKQLNFLWKFLGRKMKDDVRDHPELYSIIYVPHPVIVPGGRFREFYYWDSYWIIRGLLLSEMYSTVKGMLINFLSIVDNYGFIPNGGRIYYLMRSQPPLLIPMMLSYVEATKDYKFLEDNIKILEKEYQFWMVNRTVDVEKDGKIYKMTRFKEESSGPRPESYKEDILYAEYFRTNQEKEDFYSELKSAAESGWDFSSRWFIVNGTNKGNLTGLKIRSIIPVDLNAMMCWNADILSNMFEQLNNTRRAADYRMKHRQWQQAVTDVLWNDKIGAWLDEDLINGRRRDYFTPTNIAPLWTGCYDHARKDYFIPKVLKYLEKAHISYNQGGIPTTLEHSGEQWDFPNAWPPLQYMVIMGLDSTQDPWAKDLAFELTERWVRSNFKAFNETNAMYEKYDATIVGGYGGGGEYEVQLGFGWTNGVIMELLDKYGDRLTAEDPFASTEISSGATSSIVLSGSVSTATQIITALLAFIATIGAGCIAAVYYTRRAQYSSFKTFRYSRIPERRTVF